MALQRLDEVVEAMEEIIADVTAGVLPRDYGIFALVSLRFAVELVAHLEDGGFHDAAWVRGLALDADNRYVDAVRNVSRPGPWAITFDAADRGDGRVVRDLLLGINAHIMYDLVVTVAAAVDPAKETVQRADFLRLNDIIRTAVDGVQDQIEENAPAWLFGVDVAFGRADELLVWTMFKLTRAGAFDEALAMKNGTLTLADVEKRAVRIARGLTRLPV